ncbi:MAG: bifunctional DNA-formamidopyrimidine glycosylase/DNA-(apurinic or apyrimidinic site) lyase [Phycisphaerae bacterium]|nr:bifunctional DNA-formamidopyrimidine glycosylase/DNA-(apurinic or apyrimidinic site) lyase [Gemmatimonadaceae bacterium]
MPELPETETIARDLDAALSGATVTGITVHRADVLRETTAAKLSKSLPGSRIERVWRRAKLVVIDLAHSSAQVSSHIVVQPRFTGALLIDDGTLPADQLNYLTVSMNLEDSRTVHYRDVRRLGTVAHMSPTRFAEYAAKLGPEPLDSSLTAPKFSALVRASHRPVKALLMDQARLAGVGNIYANEALWRAGIDPSREAASLNETECVLLLEQLQAVLRESIALRGTSFRDYRDARGNRGGFVEQLAAYGRGGQPCLRCKRRLVDTHAIDGRTTVFCAYCQR